MYLSSSLKKVHIISNFMQLPFANVTSKLMWNSTTLSQYSVFNKGQDVQTELPLMVFWKKIQKMHAEVSTGLTWQLQY